MYVSLVAKFKEIIDWKRNKFVPKCIASQLNRSAFINRKCMVALSSHMILGWLGDRAAPALPHPG